MLNKITLDNIGYSKDKKITKFSRGFVMGTLSVTILIFVYSMVYGIHFGFRQNIIVGIVLLGFFTTLIQSLSEEVVFRGILLKIMSSEKGIWFGVLVSSVLFGLLHAFNSNFSLSALIVLFVAGIFYSLYKIKLDNGSLWGVFGFHTAWNFIQEFILKNNFPQAGFKNAIGALIIFILLSIIVYKTGLRQNPA